MISHFDAWGLGDPLEKRACRIRTTVQLERIVQIIGEQNVEGCKSALADGCDVWVFLSEEEVLQESALTAEECEFCLQRFTDGESWAGILRRPRTTPECVPGITVCPGHLDGSYHDPHGNYRTPSGGSGGWSH